MAYTEITVEDVTETYEDAIDSSISDYQVTQESNALLRQLPLPMIQNTTFAFGIMNQNGYSDQDWRDYWIDRDAYLRSGIVTGGILITVFMVILALILQNLSSLELRKTRVFCLPTEVTAILWGGGMVMTAVVFDTLAIETLHNGTDGLAGVLADNFGLGTASNGCVPGLAGLDCLRTGLVLDDGSGDALSCTSDLYPEGTVAADPLFQKSQDMVHKALALGYRDSAW